LTLLTFCGVADGKSGSYVDLRETPTARRGAWGTGSVHHIAWRVDDEAHQVEVRGRVTEEGARPTPVIDRFSSRFISWNQAAFFLNWPPMAQASPLTKTARISAQRWCYHHGWNRIARRLKPGFHHW
jgi:hypothetical protein